MPEPTFRRHARWLVKGVGLLLITPWRLPVFLRARLAAELNRAEFKQLLWLPVTPWRWPAFLRECAAAASSQWELRRIRLHHRARADALARGGRAEPFTRVDWFDDDAVAAWVGKPWSAIHWAPVEARDVNDPASAARYCIDSWRRRADLRARFPRALGAQREAFAAFLEASGALASAAAAEHVHHVLASDFSARARQYFLSFCSLRAVAPQALTPCGLALTLRWLLRHGMRDGGLSLEEVWWLFLQALQDPRRELVLAYQFTPAWQLEHPAALTVFGWAAFTSWFAAKYGVADGDGLDAAQWPADENPATQIRIAYWANDVWRDRHPQALATKQGACVLLDWLAGAQGPLNAAARDWVGRLDLDVAARQLAQPGINIIGHFCYPSGLRVSVESLVRGLQAAGVATTLRDVRTDVTDEPRHPDFHDPECHDITLIHTQPPSFFDRAHELADLGERRPRTYRVAYWYWEFNEIPASWLEQARHADEVWAATEFVAQGLRARLPLPVRTLFPGVKLAPFEPRTKSHFGLDERRYTFLFTFHMASVMERKNPLGLIRAFKQAFGPQEAVQLVIKTSSGERCPAAFQELIDAAADANIKLINAFYSPEDTLALIDCCDAYVSLHRSEGLGLTMAEAMLLGKPVIATNYSGNVEFMNEHNSLLVPCEITVLKKPIPPYDAGLQWAEPSVEHAARFMRRLHENPAWGRELGAKARASALESLSVEAAGARMRARIEEIRAMRRAPE